MIVGIYKWRRGEMAKIGRAVIFFSVLFLITCMFLFIRFTYLNFTGVIGLSPYVDPYTSSLAVRLSTFVHILPEYFTMILFPYHLYYEKPYVAFGSLMSVQSIISLISLSVGAILAVFSIIKRRGEVFLGLSWFIVALLPVSGIIPLNAMYLEHWLYLPIVGIIFLFSFIASRITYRLPRLKQSILFYIFLIILLLFATRIILRNREWANPVRFYQNELKYTQVSARIYNNLAMEMADRGDCALAIPHYEKAISLNDTYPETHHNLAQCLVGLNKIEEAADQYLQALSLEPNFIYSLDGLRVLLSAVGDKRSEKFLALEIQVQKGEKLTQEDIARAIKP
jgi:tetratricopeptide (TPR) repeat protein